MNCLICNCALGVNATTQGDRSRAVLCAKCVRDVCEEMRGNVGWEQNEFDEGFDEGFDSQFDEGFDLGFAGAA